MIYAHTSEVMIKWELKKNIKVPDTQQVLPITLVQSSDTNCLDLNVLFVFFYNSAYILFIYFDIWMCF